MSEIMVETLTTILLNEFRRMAEDDGSYFNEDDGIFDGVVYPAKSAAAILRGLDAMGLMVVEKDALEKAHAEGVDHGWELASDASSED